jgi:hypothetical protein
MKIWNTTASDLDSYRTRSCQEKTSTWKIMAQTDEIGRPSPIQVIRYFHWILHGLRSLRYGNLGRAHSGSDVTIYHHVHSSQMKLKRDCVIVLFSQRMSLPLLLVSLFQP